MRLLHPFEWGLVLSDEKRAQKSFDRRDDLGILQARPWSNSIRLDAQIHRSRPVLRPARHQPRDHRAHNMEDKTSPQLDQVRFEPQARRSLPAVDQEHDRELRVVSFLFGGRFDFVLSER